MIADWFTNEMSPCGSFDSLEDAIGFANRRTVEEGERTDMSSTYTVYTNEGIRVSPEWFQ